MFDIASADHNTGISTQLWVISAHSSTSFRSMKTWLSMDNFLEHNSGSDKKPVYTQQSLTRQGMATVLLYR
jgi:hypothetical protein